MNEVRILRTADEVLEVRNAIALRELLVEAREALRGVIAVADRDTDEFNRARAVLYALSERVAAGEVH